jgi:hypothetical protein
MIDTRVLCIAGGGNGNAGGGGAGGFLEFPSLALLDFTKYEVKVGLGGEVGGNGGDSYFYKPQNILETQVWSLGIYGSTDTEVVDVSALVAGATGVIWLELNLSGTQQNQNDGTYAYVEGVSLIGHGFDGRYFIDVTSLLAGKTTITLSTNNNSNSATATFKFISGYEVFSFGGGRGVYGDESGKRGGSGGGSAGSGASAGSGTSPQGFAGGVGSASKGTHVRHDAGAGGGGGAGGAGLGGKNRGHDGGIGKISNILGSDVYYAGGGAGSISNGSGSNGLGQENYGGGGFGTGTTTGKDGAVIIRYTRADVPHTFIGGTITDVGGDRVHVFEADGFLEPFLPPTAIPALI